MASSPAASAALKAALSPSITVRALAEACGVTDQAVFNWMGGGGRPAVHHRALVEKLTGVHRSSWLTDEEREAAGLPPRENAA